LATSAIVEDLSLLATSSVIADMASLAGSGANPNITTLTASGEIAAASLDISGNVDVDGTLEADAITINGTAIASVLSPVAGSSSIVTTGALNAGSITSGFGAIDNGSSAITTTGVGSFGSLDISGNIDVDGTANLDVVDIDGAVDMASTLTLAGNADFNGNLDVDGTTDLDTTNVVGAFTVTGDVTLNDGSPNLRLQDSDVSRFVDILYGTRVATFRNTMASGEDIDTVEPSMVFSFKDDSETRTAMTIDHDGQVGIGTSSPASQLDLAGGATNSSRLRLNRGTDDANQFMTLGYDNISVHRANVALASAQTNMKFQQVGSDGTRTSMQIDSSGHVTKSAQPAFQVFKSSDQNNIAADNSSVVVTWQTEAFDIGSNFASNTFTAPVTGKYLLTAKLRIDNADSASSYYILKLVCSNGDAFDIFDSNVFSSDITYITLQVTTVQDMDANDTAQVQITQQGGTAQSDIIDARHYSNFSGYLLG